MPPTPVFQTRVWAAGVSRSCRWTECHIEGDQAATPEDGVTVNVAAAARGTEHAEPRLILVGEDPAPLELLPPAD